VGARFSATVQTGPGVHPASCTMGTGSFPGGKERPRRDADPSPPSSAVGHERVELYLYCPYGPYGLYRASVPVQGYTLPIEGVSIQRATTLIVGWFAGHMCKNDNKWYTDSCKLLCNFIVYYTRTCSLQILPRDA